MFGSIGLRGKFKGNPTGRHQFSTTEEMNFSLNQIYLGMATGRYRVSLANTKPDLQLQLQLLDPNLIHLLHKHYYILRYLEHGLE
ncbi:hypothetical protein LguiB_025891 [Lonicera macranthoides]